MIEGAHRQVSESEVRRHGDEKYIYIYTDV